MGDIVLNRLAGSLGPVEIIATGPADSPLPVTGPCSRCGTTMTRYGPAGSPLCDQLPRRRSFAHRQVRQGRRTGLRRPPNPVTRRPDLRRSAPGTQPSGQIADETNIPDMCITAKQRGNPMRLTAVVITFGSA